MRGRKTILGFCSNLLCIRSIYQSPIKGLQNLNGLFNFLFHRFSVERFHLFKIRVLILFSSDLLCVSCSPISSVKLKNTSCSELWFRHVSSHWSESLSDGSVFLVMCQICICIWNGSGDTFSGFLTGCYHPVYSGMSVDSFLVVEKMAALCAMFLSQSEKTFIFLCVCVMNLRSFSCMVSGTHTLARVRLCWSVVSIGQYPRACLGVGKLWS